MGFTRFLLSVLNVQALNDRPNANTGLTADQVKATFDQAGSDLKTYLNSTLTTELESVTDGSSGADNIGATVITDLTGSTVQTLLESLRDNLKSGVDGASGANFIGVTPISSLVGEDVQTALESLGSKATNVQAQVDMLVVDGDSSPEAAQARVDANGVTHVTLKARDDSDYNTLNRQNRPIVYGKLTMPSDFSPVLPCVFYRDNDGLIKHNMDFTRYTGGTKIYVTAAGNDTTGDGSVATPYRTLTKAIAIAIAGANAKYEITTSVPIFNRDECVFNQTVTNKTIAIVSTVEGRTVFSSNSTYTWTLDGTGTYKATRSGVASVTDNLNRDAYGVPVPMLKATSTANCQATANTYYADATTVWVHRSDGVTPTNANTLIGIGVAGLDPDLGTGGVLYFENFIFSARQNSNNSLRVQNPSATPFGELCINSCCFVGRTDDTAGNGLTTENIKNVYVFDSIAAYSQLDGFNYHAADASCFAMEYNCKAYDIGLVLPGAASNNASSAHDSMHILRIGTIGYRNTGATIIDVNGCYSILYDCHARTPVTSGVDGVGTVFQFTSEGVYAGLGKTYMYNCSAMDCDDALVIGSTHVAYVNNFKFDGDVGGAGTINYI